ncbi:MAG: GNAT family N-acetyltransferase [Vicinamibacterales bacterium]
MTVAIRELRPGEERLFLELHAQSVRGLAAGHYTPEVIDAWCVAPTEENLANFISNPDHELRLFAEIDGQVVGLAALVVEGSELRACYVLPGAARKGVGTALVREMERRASAHHLDHLELLASINAESFYAALGYASESCTEHNMRGYPMAAVKMSKRLR